MNAPPIVASYQRSEAALIGIRCHLSTLKETFRRYAPGKIEKCNELRRQVNELDEYIMAVLEELEGGAE